MKDKLEMSLLLDFYGALLTDKQRDISELYYNGDFSLSEIADDLSISRQGVRDALVRAEASLTGLEEKIGFVKKYREIMNADKRIKDIALDVISAEHNKYINARMREIIDIIDSIAVS